MRGIIHLLGAGTIALGTVHGVKAHKASEHHSRGLTMRNVRAHNATLGKHPRVHRVKF
jgi:hypothetical protein